MRAGFFFAIILINSCVPYKTLISYNEPPPVPATPQAISNFSPIVIQPDDMLSVQVNSSDPLAIMPFMLGATEGAASGSGDQGAASAGYLVDSTGNINFPTLGRVALAGLTIPQASEKLAGLLDPYFEDVPILNVRLLNFKISVSGEVNSPGIFNIAEERVTVLEALVMAGDLSDYAMRDSVLIIREDGGNRTFDYLNLYSAEVFNSPYFYLHQNDVLYVRPYKSKRGAIRPPANNVLPWVSAIT